MFKKKNIIILIVLFSLSYYISNYWYQLLLIQGRSMEPTFHNFQLVLVSRCYDNYKIGDVICFQCDSLNSVLVKRIVACEGDIVQIIDGKLWVNGELSIVYPKDTIFNYSGIASREVCLEKEQFFVIGDNINESIDSRFQEVGIIKIGDIIGKIF